MIQAHAMIENHQNAIVEKNWFNASLNNKDLIQRLKKIKLIVADIDGTLTNNYLTVYPGIEEEIKSFSVVDGLGIEQARKQGLIIAFLSGKKGSCVERRARALGIPDHCIMLGRSGAKTPYIHELQKTCNVSREQTLLFGDDVVDWAAHNAVELFAAPSSALFYIITGAGLTVPRPAGSGPFRLLLDLILYAQGIHPYAELIDHALKASC